VGLAEIENLELSNSLLKGCKLLKIIDKNYFLAFSNGKNFSNGNKVLLK
jgi:hypothetical protein